VVFAVEYFLSTVSCLLPATPTRGAAHTRRAGRRNKVPFPSAALTAETWCLLPYPFNPRKGMSGRHLTCSGCDARACSAGRVNLGMGRSLHIAHLQLDDWQGERPPLPARYSSTTAHHAVGCVAGVPTSREVERMGQLRDLGDRPLNPDSRPRGRHDDHDPAHTRPSKFASLTSTVHLACNRPTATDLQFNIAADWKALRPKA
jgi:hypothetical protein